MRRKKKRGRYEQDDSVLEEDYEEEDEVYAEEEDEEPYEEKPKGPAGRVKRSGMFSESDRYTMQVLGRFFAPVGILLGLLVLVVVLVPKLAGDRSADLQTKADKINSLTDEYEALELEIRQLENGGSASLAGVYTGKENDAQWQLDDEKASAFFAKITTWSNGDDYDGIRKDMLSAGYVETDSLMTCFLPKMNDDWDTDPDSPTFNQFVREIDKKGLNCAFEGLTSYRVSTDGAQSRYVALVEMSSRDMSGSGITTEAKAYVKYTVEAATGNLSNMEAYVLDD